MLQMKVAVNIANILTLLSCEHCEKGTLTDGKPKSSCNEVNIQKIMPIRCNEVNNKRIRAIRGNDVNNQRIWLIRCSEVINPRISLYLYIYIYIHKCSEYITD